MLNAVNTKILLAILAALLAIACALAYHRHEAARAAELHEYGDIPTRPTQIASR